MSLMEQEKTEKTEETLSKVEKPEILGDVLKEEWAEQE